MSDRLVRFLSEDLRRLLADGERLLVDFSSLRHFDRLSAQGGNNYYDYSFLVFPFAKVYEGFLKELFFKIGAISQEQYFSDHWRVGRALNPMLEKELRHTESVYDRLVEKCGGTQVADVLWDAWKRGRNQVFHYFPHKYVPLTLDDAKTIISQINQAMEKALEDCRI